MALEIATIDQVTSTSARCTLSGGGADPAGVSTRWEFQISTDENFRFAVSPRWSIPNSGDGRETIPGLNAGTTYFVRARNRYSASVEDWGRTVGFTTAAGPGRITAPSAILTEPAAIVVPTPILSVVFASPAIAGFPESNMLVDAPVAARTLGPDSDPNSCIILFCTAGSPVDTFALLNTNMPEDAQIEIWDAPTQAAAANRAYASLLPARQFRASARLPGRPGYHALVRSPAPMAGPWFGIKVTNAATPGRVKHFEHLVVGLNRVTKNHSAEVSVSPQPQTTIDRKRSGIADRVPGIPLRRVEFELAVLTEAQFEEKYQDLWRRENYPVLVVPNTKPGSFLHDRIFFGDLSGGRVSQSNIRYTRGFSVVSMI